MIKSPLRRIINRVLHSLARVLPGGKRVRPFLHRLRGVKVGANVFIGDQVYLENEHPESVEIQSGVQISVRAIILAHTRGPGRIVIEKDAFIGPNVVVATSRGQTLRIGEGTVIGAGAVINKDIPAHVFVASAAATPLAGLLLPSTKRAMTRVSESLYGLLNDNGNGEHPTRRTQLRHAALAELSIEMNERDEIRNSVFRALERVKEVSLNLVGRTSEESVVLLGEGAELDSMDFVNFVVAVEEEMSRISDRQLSIIDVISSAKGHLPRNCSVGELIDLICQLTRHNPSR